MRQYLFTIVGLVLYSVHAFAQQTPVFSDYNYNTIIINPAHTGLNEETEIAFTNRGLVDAFDGTPKYLSLSASIPRDYSGFGGGILRDEIGVTTTTHFFASYAYKIFLSQDSNVPRWHNGNPHVMSFGISAGVLQYAEDLLDLNITNDINFAQNINTSIPTIGAGFLYNERNFYVGIAAPNIVGDLLSSEKNVELVVPYYAYGAYKLYFGNQEEFLLKPNALVIVSNGAPTQVDMNVFLNYKSKLEAGIGYRTNSLVNMLVGCYIFSNVRLNYTYNIALNNSPLGSSQGFSLSYRAGSGYGGRR
ncbi:PorP/SprF family type IX secretion system membrane protein [uncultured Dokdonia sp.]|uniref:PorP/SprF family type IX secretion system membrane protein n=1 Tax=uncultured Dokdonia sp. TaxID=575653 RepID=UPI002607837D|nr:PorP/SprF family type IX secretion system membrane protein [uncultured Dokdonia sp.]